MKRSLGVLGGGQLGRMMIQDAINLDIEISCLDPDPNASCSKIAHSFTVGNLNDFEAVLKFGRKHKVLTVEIENVSIEALEILESEGVKVFPQSSVLKTIKHKGLQKEFYRKYSIPSADFQIIENKSEIDNRFRYPFVHKLCIGGYDGKGVKMISSKSEWDVSFEGMSLVEEMIPFSKELSLIIARNENGELKSFPLVECEFNAEANLVEFQFSPADVSNEIEQKAKEIAEKIILSLNMVGILAVEFFLTNEGELLVNEIAPRPHNSGHHTIECCQTSQFAQHLRAVLNLPLGNTSLIRSGAMLNIVGEKEYEGTAYYEGMEEVLAMEGVYLHLYGKEKTKAFRKMGHVTIVGNDLEGIRKKSDFVQRTLRCISK